MCRSLTVLPRQQLGNQAIEAGSRIENLRMEHSGESATSHNVLRPRPYPRLPLLDERRSSLRSKRRSRLSRMFPFWKHHVRFSPHVREYIETIWSEEDCRNARKGPWLHFAADRHRFMRRIRDFDDDFLYIFTDIHREHICDLLEEFNVNALVVNLNTLNLND